MERIRVVIAKPGLDGHDRGAKIVARGLRDAGMEVVYLGLRNTPARIASVAVQEDIDVVGLSVLSGSHLPLARKVLAALQEAGGGDIPVVIGGTIPPADIPELQGAGIAAVLPTRAPLGDIVATIRRLGRKAKDVGSAT